MPLKTLAFEVESIEYGPIVLELVDGQLQFSRTYSLLDADGVSFQTLFSDLDFERPKVIEGSVAWVDVPIDIQNALVQIDTYIKDQIYIKEGI